YETMPPRKFLEFGVAFIPQQRISLAVHRVHVSAGGVTVRLLVSAGGNLRYVRMHRSIGEDEAHIQRSFAARFELVELGARQVINEIRFPHVPDRRLREDGVGPVIPLALEMLGE